MSKPLTKKQITDLVTQLSELIELEKQFKETTGKQIESLKKQLASYVVGDPEEGVTLTGRNGAILSYSAAPASYKCSVTPAEFIHRTQAWGAVDVSAAAARKILSQESFEDLFEKSHGTRRLLVAKGPDRQAGARAA